MKIRTQLVLAFLLLSVLPLTAIVLYSYYSSLSAVRAAYETEAAGVSKEMSTRMAAIRDDIRERVENIGQLPLEALVADQQSSNAVRALVVQKLGDKAPLIKSFEYVPAVPLPPMKPLAGTARVETPIPAPAPAPAVAATPAVPSAPSVPTPEEIAEIRAQAQRAAAAAARVQAIHDVQMPIIINVEEIVRQTRESTSDLPAEKQQKILAQLQRDLSRVPRAMKTAPTSSDPDERAAEVAAAVDEVVSSAVENAESATDAERDAMAPQADTDDDPDGPEEVAEVDAPADTRPRERAARREKQKEMKLVFGHDLEVPVLKAGSVVGKVKAQVSGREVLDRVLRSARPQEGEIAFAVDREGVIYTVQPQDKVKLAALPIKELTAGKPNDQKVFDNWVVATNRDEVSGSTYGIARPIRKPLQEVKQTAARNFGYGLGLIVLALFGIVPIANHMTRDVHAIAAGAERIAQGDLTTRVPVRTSNEFGHLAESFNRMARDLSENQMRLVEEERLRREQEFQQRLLEAEYARKSQELEDARDFQLSLLPKVVPSLRDVSIDVFMRTAAEVGGDYYDFHVGADGALTVVVGDATGHGARAATMVTVIKSLFAGYDSSTSPAQFLGDANETVKRMQLGRMAMGLTLARLDGRRLTIAAAGMPPVFVRDAAGAVREIELSGTPLGTLSATYDEQVIELRAGDTLLLMSDGFPELMGREGEPFGYARVEEALRDAGATPTEVIHHLTRVADAWSDEQTDDITFVALRLA